jgi:hypothetical protein
MHSSLVPKAVDHSINFVDCQSLQKVINSLSLSQHTLRSIEHIVLTIQSTASHIRRPCYNSKGNYSQQMSRISGYVGKIRGFIQTAKALEKQANGHSLLVS